MCKKRSSVKMKLPTGKVIRVDKCLIPDILGLWDIGFETLGSCCGHGKYPKTIVVRDDLGNLQEAFTSIRLPRVRRFYRMDIDGFYYIPEICGDREGVLEK